MTVDKVTFKKILAGPGVYLFKRGLKILYIGRATNLRSRTRSYFDPDVAATRGGLIVAMVERATRIQTIPTDSVLEAIFLEAHLIKKHQPYANTDEKSNKSFAVIVITKEDFPRILLIRERDIATRKFPVSDIKYQFGPFVSKSIAFDALKIVRRIFSYRDNSCKPGQGKPCFNRQIGLCPGVCTGEISKKDYARTIRVLKLFFEGKRAKLVKQLERDMKSLARERKFEEAEIAKRQVSSLRHIHDVGLMKREVLAQHQGFRIEAYDVAHLGGDAHVGVMTVVEGGALHKDGYRKFKIKSVQGANDTAALAEILSRRLAHPEWPYPRLIVVDGGTVQINVAEKVLKEAGIEIPVVGVVKDEFHRARELRGDQTLIGKHHNDIVLANVEAHRFAIKYHRASRGLFKN